MGQYHKTVNLDKQEFINPHKLGMGLKLLEQSGFEGSMGDILFMLLASSNGRGGGDIDTKTNGLIGRWAGDRIAVIGDYSEPDDIADVNAKDIYRFCREPEDLTDEDRAWLREKNYKLFTDISDSLVALVNEQFDCSLDVNQIGWRRREANPHIP